ncbi:MAG: CapA family protein [Patescibacteria group bacterium]
MDKKTRNIIVIGVISVFSFFALFGFFKVAHAPFQEIIKKLAIQRDERVVVANSRLPEVSEEKPIEFIFGGDVMLSRQVNKKMESYNNYVWPFLKIADYLKRADLTVVNLESPFVITKDYSVQTGSFLFKVNPKAITGLLSAGIDLVSLANNHSFNQGSEGLADTFKILNDNGIKYIGAGKNEDEARRGEVVEINNQKFGFLAYAYPEDNSVAGANTAGIADMDLKKMKSDVERLKKEVATVIVEMHAGVEYTTKPNEQQTIFARAAIDAGAAAVIGHHPHWPQTFEFYKGQPIIYSLGNLIFDQMWSKETQQGMLVKMVWNNNSWERVEFVPIKIYDYGQAELMPAGAEKNAILKKIGAPEDGVIRGK